MLLSWTGVISNGNWSVAEPPPVNASPPLRPGQGRADRPGEAGRIGLLTKGVTVGIRVCFPGCGSLDIAQPCKVPSVAEAQLRAMGEYPDLRIAPGAMPGSSGGLGLDGRRGLHLTLAFSCSGLA